MTQDEGYWAKDDVTLYDFWGKFQTVLFFKVGFIIKNKQIK